MIVTEFLNTLAYINDKTAYEEAQRKIWEQMH